MGWTGNGRVPPFLSIYRTKGFVKMKSGVHERGNIL